MPILKPRLTEGEYNQHVASLQREGFLINSARRFRKESVWKASQLGFDYYETMLAVENMKQLYNGPIILNPQKKLYDHMKTYGELVTVVEKDTQYPKEVLTDYALRRVCVLIDAMRGGIKYDKIYAYHFQNQNPITWIIGILFMLGLTFYVEIRERKG